MAEIPFICSRFDKTKSDGSKVKLRIQEMRKCDLNSVLNFMDKWYIHEESFMRACGISKSADALNEYKNLTSEILKSNKNHSLICCVDNDTDNLIIVGVNYLYLSKKGEDTLPTELQTKEVASFIRIVEELPKIYNEIERLQVDSYLGGVGLSVDPSYRGCGIATALLEARFPIMQRDELSVTSAWFTSSASQRAAQKAGFVEVAEIEFDELGRRTNVVFTDAPPTAKLMIFQI